MRIVKYLLILALNISTLLQADVGWSPPVTFDPPGDSPELDINFNGNAVCVWKTSSGAIVSKKFDFATKTWSATLPLPPPQPGDLPRVAINSNGDAVAIWQDGPLGAFFGSILEFGANAWSLSSQVLPNNALSSPALTYVVNPIAYFRNTSGQNIPGAMFNGNIWTLLPTFTPLGSPQLDSDGDVFALVWSADNTNLRYAIFSLSQAQGAAGGILNQFGTDPQISIEDSERAVAIWVSEPSKTIKGAILPSLVPNQANWTPTNDLSPPGQIAEQPKIAFGGGRFVSVWVDTTNNAVQAATLTNTTWTNTSPVSPLGQPVDEPQVAVDSSGNAYAIWVNKTNNILQGATLAAGSNTWIATNDLSQPGASHPRLEAAPTGNALAVWQLLSDVPEAVPLTQIQSSFFPFTMPVSSLSPPSNFNGTIQRNIFATQTDLIHTLTWNPTPDPAVEGYRLFENGVLVATIPASGPFTFTLHNRCRGQTYTYTLVAFNGSSVSSPVTLTLP